MNKSGFKGKSNGEMEKQDNNTIPYHTERRNIVAEIAVAHQKKIVSLRRKLYWVMKKSKKIDEVKILQKSAKIGSSKARRSSKAMGLTIKVISNNEIIEKSPDGKEKVLKKIDTIVPTQTKGLKKGTVLCRK